MVKKKKKGKGKKVKKGKRLPKEKIKEAYQHLFC